MNERAILAGGCFWGMEELFRQLPGVTHTQVGYTGGTLKNPAYKDITTGLTGHAEALEITYDPAKISYRGILAFFFKIHDPTTPNRQGNDRGNQYRSLIGTLNAVQQEIATNFIKEIEQSGKWPGPVVTAVEPAGDFYPAEDYHQNYLQKNIGGYTCHYVRPDWMV